jgi:V8-like Glu-specific endopeptidase
MSDTRDQQAGSQSAPRLSGSEIGRLRDLLHDAFPRPRFDELLLFRLDRRVDDYAGPNDDYPTALRKVIQEANAALWWRDLLSSARKAVPGDPGLLEFGEELGLAPAPVEAAGRYPLRGRRLELRIRAAQSTFDVGTWRRRLGEIEGRVCRIEYPEGTAEGTGFLVAPDVVLTNYHVVEPFIENGIAGDATAVVIRFDYKVAEDGVAVQAGTTRRLAEDWLADFSPYSEQDLKDEPSADPEPGELDYALLRVDGAPGKEPVGGATRDQDPVPRGWITVPATEHDFATQPALYIIQHPDGQPMQVALDTEAVIGLNGNGTRVRYTTTTEPGSSGSPCFGPDWELVAFHHSGDPKYWMTGDARYNEGIPTSAMRRLLTKRGKDGLLGGAARVTRRDNAMPHIQLRHDQVEEFHQALLARYDTRASAEDMLLRLQRSFRHIAVTGSTYPQDLLAVIRAAQSEGWLLPLVRQVRQDIPGDQELLALEAELVPPGPPPHVDDFDMCCLAGRVMVDRSGLRDSLRRLSTATGKRIMVITGRKSSGKSHSLQLISYLIAMRGGFSLAFIDLADYGPVLGANEEIKPNYVARALARKLHYDFGPLKPPKDSQWARWVLDFCEDLETRALDDDRSCWVVIDGFGNVPLAQATVDLIKGLAVRINRSLPRFRLILLGYDDTFPPGVLPQVMPESIKPIGIRELTDFFGRAYRQLGLQATEDTLVDSVSRVLAGLDLEHEDFLFQLEPRVSDELAAATGQGGGS